MSKNQVIIYSNGIADFRRSFLVGTQRPEKVSIPIRQDHLADVLASFNVFGNVRLDSPPTYRPSNDLEGNISVNPNSVLVDLASSLSGSNIEIERASGQIAGKLMGLHQEEEGTAGSPIKSKSLIVLCEDGLRSAPLREIQSFRFLDAEVRAEIDKALQRNYQKIKPNSTFVDLVVSAEEEAEAIIQYTVPAAAWKISYRLRMSDERPAELQGFAIVDNNTDEDWDQFHISVVTGEPITFSTDLADRKTPGRKHVNLVSDMALGAVEVEDGMVVMAGPAAGGAIDGLDDDISDRSIVRKRSARFASPKPEAMPSAAEMTSAEVHEVGDFTRFESEGTVSIPAKQSAVIPVFRKEIGDTESILHYKRENHKERPFRSIEFKNETSFSLGRGACTVYEDSAYAGSCVIPTLKPGESRLLPHALDTGVKINRERANPFSSTLIALHIGDGTVSRRLKKSGKMEYHIKNSLERSQKLVLDHDRLLEATSTRATLSLANEQTEIEHIEKLSGGLRYKLVLPPNSECCLTIHESHVEDSEISLVTVTNQSERLNVEWLEKNIICNDGPLADNAHIQECISANEALQQKKSEISSAIVRSERLMEKQNRLRENIKAGGQDELTNRWRHELDGAEQEIQEIEQGRVPHLREEESKLYEKLRTALKELAVEWNLD